MNMKDFEQKQASERIKVWNFNDPEGWEKFSKLTESSAILILSDMWQVGHHIEISYEKWQNNLNGMYTCALRKRESDAPRVSIRKKLDSSLKRESS